MVVKISNNKVVQKAANLIKKGELVAFPTETVYGLGVDALNPEAIRKIFQAKGRPSDNPLIVHIADLKDLQVLAENIPKEAYFLAEKYWPGPLTFILDRQKIVPDEITGRLETVAIRMPKNEIALNLIKLSETPIAAPSANKSGRPSPTDAETVFEDFGNEIAMILDGGKTEFGLESTVIDLSKKPFSVLRTGAISKEELEEFLREKISIASHADSKPKSPGMKYKHYAPKAELVLVIPAEAGILCFQIQKLINYYKLEKKKIGVLCRNENAKNYKNADLVISVGSIKNLKEISSNLFRTLRQFDHAKIDIILSESFPEQGIGQAIMDRLTRASSKSIANF
ncbi:MAG: sua5 superfamily-like protein, tRNA threonylcarbamoyladenosine biosynthesis protein [Candidatus Peregrinibacteria bacterium GW2011_GWF2_33_10]|nr:MAG: sua5 superfamily-like protein, tRNA threonylcarbamoyladenosine biosynthesis protein [Candidatus Peregrinibacteria bacterium GW2011_GWF2_33_10]OGJ44812.1 MAG: threonylcarbamoyl-AMP synthase [Candidatus Peregrinibacteria bacterium RIFOXYA2_FULL_33_21]OGJ47395.1 MAG: threonylcarbamoyl-AMP synthase [Candidatus Peregrinibacteria bacterium RIFOXYA12_FULL_33_12]OGJ50498.1 MAG: threonylcarbamoyl-AMP synthase [Candidatus Peregrinibacteria bacterium RIFOXYB2_FULL_33_20]